MPAVAILIAIDLLAACNMPGMDANSAFAAFSQYIVSVVVAGGGLALVSFGLFRFFGSKWLESKFAERLQNLKAEQDQAIRHVQSTIDREIHRARKLYDSEFTALSTCWPLLREVFDESVGTVASFTARVERMTDEEFERFLVVRGVEEWQRNQLKELTGNSRQDAFYRWAEWERYKRILELWRKFRSHFDANSIFFADGFSERFRELEQLSYASIMEFGRRVEYHGRDHAFAHSFDATQKVSEEGGPKMKALEEMVRKRLWSVAKDGSA